MEKVRVFIGSGEASVLERKTLIHSIRKNSKRDIDIYVFNGTHNSIELNDEPPMLAPMSLRTKYYNVTEFSNYRFLIPQICGFQGRAIFVDSDTICLGDIGELFDAEMGHKAILAKKNAYNKLGEDRWGLSVSLMDCAKCTFDLEKYFDEIDAGLYSYADLHQLTPQFLKLHPFSIGEIDANWNVFDLYDQNTKLIHYTNLYTQPWKAHGHKFAPLWFQYFNEARRSGVITEADIDTAIVRSYVRRDLVAADLSIVKQHFYGLVSALKRKFIKS